MRRGSLSTSKPAPRKQKSKSKSRQKIHKFDPLQYLNSLIGELHDTRHSTNKKRQTITTKRDLASAMTHPTPYTQRTAASSKIRTKSSHSRIRKKSVMVREPLKINMNFVTEEDNIQFTENTARGNQSTQNSATLKIIGLSRGSAARKIQRAWRNYQTKKMVKKYYDYYRVANKQPIVNRQKLGVKMQSSRLRMHTLRIRKEGKECSISTLIMKQSPHRMLSFSDEVETSKAKQINSPSCSLQIHQGYTIELPHLQQTCQQVIEVQNLRNTDYLKVPPSLDLEQQSLTTSNLGGQSENGIMVIDSTEFKSAELVQSALKECQSTSSLNVSLHQHSFREGERSRMVRECSENMQVQIQELLLWQFVEEIYSSINLWPQFKSLVDTPYQFKGVVDYQIFNFLDKQLPLYYKYDFDWIQKLNQAINPSSAQILRLIRDFDFQIKEYDLILPQEVFKAYRRNLELQYSVKMQEQQSREIVLEKRLSKDIGELVSVRRMDKQTRTSKLMSFQRDLKIMYMKAVFNCYNELIIQVKSARSFMTNRSSIGPGQLTLALKQYNPLCTQPQAQQIMQSAKQKINDLIKFKCQIPVFTSSQQIEFWQKQLGNIINHDLQQHEHKWVNYMDEVLQLWQDISCWLIQLLVVEVAGQLGQLC